MDIRDYYSIVVNKAEELKKKIQNGSIKPLESWDLDEDFNAWLAPSYLNVLSVNGTISLLMHFVVFWLIMFKTPKEMKDYKIFLLNIAIISFLHDILFSIYWRPVPLFPVPAAFVQGPSKIIGDIGGHWGMVMSIVLITLYMCSMVCGFFYRLVALMDTYYYRIIMSWMGLVAVIVVHGFPTILLGGMMHFSYVPSDIIKNKTLQRFPQLAPILENEAVFGYDVEENPILVYFFIIVLVFIFLIVPLIEIGCILTILYKLREMKAAMSQKTYKLHKNLLLALTVQILLSQVMILIPDVGIVFGAWKEWPNVNIIAEAALILCTFHSVLDNFVMLLVITPYRKTLIEMFKKFILGNLKGYFNSCKNQTTVIVGNTASVQPSNHEVSSRTHNSNDLQNQILQKAIEQAAQLRFEKENRKEAKILIKETRARVEQEYEGAIRKLKEVKEAKDATAEEERPQEEDEVKKGIQNGSIKPLESWDLDEDFNAWLAPSYLNVLSVNGTISLLMHFVVFWLIMFKTPKEMKDYKIFLLNIAVISFIHDIQLTVYWRPVPFFPIPAAFVQGPSKIIGDIGGHWGMVMSIVLITLYMCSMVCGFFYRLVALMDTYYYRIIMSWMGLVAVIVVHGFPTILLGGMMHFSYVPSDIIKNKTLQRFPQLAPILENEAVFGYDVEENPILVYFFIIVLVFIFLIVPLIEIGCILTILYKLREMKAAMSQKTYKLHKNLLLALTVQILLPQVMILIPDVGIVFGAWKEWPNVNIIAETTLMLCTFHSVLDNFVMLLVITPYRKTLIEMFKKFILGNIGIHLKCLKKTTIIIVKNSTTAQPIVNSVSSRTQNSNIPYH